MEEITFTDRAWRWQWLAHAQQKPLPALQGKDASVSFNACLLPALPLYNGFTCEASSALVPARAEGTLFKPKPALCTEILSATYQCPVARLIARTSGASLKLSGPSCPGPKPQRSSMTSALIRRAWLLPLAKCYAKRASAIWPKTDLPAIGAIWSQERRHAGSSCPGTHLGNPKNNAEQLRT